MAIRRSTGEKIFDFFNIIFMLFLMLITLYPFIYILNLSLSTPTGSLMGGFFLTPNGFSLEAYRRVLNSPHIWIGYKNTIIVTVGGTAVNMFFTTITAYALSKKFLWGRGVISGMIVFTMLFSGGMIPTYLLVRSLGLINSRLALILPGMISAYNMIIMRNFFQELPEELEEAALIEGASVYRILFTIVVPLSTPVLAAITLFYAVGHWNDFFQCLIYIESRSKIVLQLLLREIVMQSRLREYLPEEFEAVSPTHETVKSATVFIATLPILMVYPFMQKYFVKGVMIGSIKG